jgi:hypothetical protein
MIQKSRIVGPGENGNTTSNYYLDGQVSPTSNAFVQLYQGTISKDSSISDLFSQLNTVEFNLILGYMMYGISAYGSNLKKYLDLMSSSPMMRSDINVEALYKVISYMFNTDILNGVPSINNGWEQYSINDVSSVTGTVPLKINGNLKLGVPLKCIGLKYWGSETISSTGKAGTVNISITGKDGNGKTVYLNDTNNTNPLLAYPGDPSVLFPTVYAFPLIYPFTVTSIELSVTSSNGTYINGSDINGNPTGGLLFVYQ